MLTLLVNAIFPHVANYKIRATTVTSSLAGWDANYAHRYLFKERKYSKTSWICDGKS